RAKLDESRTSVAEAQNYWGFANFPNQVFRRAIKDGFNFTLMVKLVENTVKLNLTLVDTPGFGDAVNNTRCWEPIINYVDGKFLEYFSEETKIERKERPVD
ncbi:unnamed protein product, partial [Strongylus vulgaris]